MPTGSLCAERNVIGTALADDFGLRRTHLRMIAVLGLDLEEELAALKSTAVPTTAPAPRGHDGDCVIPTDTSSKIALAAPPRRSPVHIKVDASPGDVAAGDGGSPILAPPTLKVPESPPHLKRVRSYPKIISGQTWSPAASAEKVVEVRQSDMNPLKPCGACREWLKKIAEVSKQQGSARPTFIQALKCSPILSRDPQVNPSFKVLTFTDQDGTGVYVEQVVDS